MSTHKTWRQNCEIASVVVTTLTITYHMMKQLHDLQLINCVAPMGTSPEDPIGILMPLCPKTTDANHVGKQY